MGLGAGSDCIWDVESDLQARLQVRNQGVHFPRGLKIKSMPRLLGLVSVA